MGTGTTGWKVELAPDAVTASDPPASYRLHLKLYLV